MMLSHSTRRTTLHLRSALAVAGLAVLATACGDTSVAPNGQPRAASHGAAMVKYDGSRTFTFDPSGSMTLPLGDHKISFDPGSVCDPSTSSYGVGTWDSGCTPLSSPINITASW